MSVCCSFYWVINKVAEGKYVFLNSYGFNWVSFGTDNRTCRERSERNSDCCAVCANRVYTKQTVLSHHRALHGSLRVLFVCYVRYARFPQMLRACVSLCLRSAARVQVANIVCRQLKNCRKSVAVTKKRRTKSSFVGTDNRT